MMITTTDKWTKIIFGKTKSKQITPKVCSHVIITSRLVRIGRFVNGIAYTNKAWEKIRERERANGPIDDNQSLNRTSSSSKITVRTEEATQKLNKKRVFYLQHIRIHGIVRQLCRAQAHSDDMHFVVILNTMSSPSLDVCLNPLVRYTHRDTYTYSVELNKFNVKTFEKKFLFFFGIAVCLCLIFSCCLNFSRLISNVANFEWIAISFIFILCFFWFHRLIRKFLRRVGSWDIGAVSGFFVNYLLFRLTKAH